MDSRWRRRAARVSEGGVVREPWNISTLSTGSFTPSPAPPPPFTAACFSRGRGRLTTNGLHLSLPLELSKGLGPPQGVGEGTTGTTIQEQAERRFGNENERE